MKSTTVKFAAALLLFGAGSVGFAIAQEPDLDSEVMQEQASEDSTLTGDTLGAEALSEDTPTLGELEEPAEDTLAEDPMATEETLGKDIASDDIAGEDIAVDESMVEEPIAQDEALTEDVASKDPIADDLAQEDSLSEESIAREDSGTIIDVAESAGSFEVLATALEAAGLTELLESDGPFTVFAPTDDAFYALPGGQLEALLQPENQEQLIALLTYHVVPGKVLSTDLQEGEVQTVEGNTVDISLEDGVNVNEANVVEPDVEASNGVIHVVDSVILPEPIALAPEVDTTPETELAPDTEELAPEVE
ncbi:MAG: fasciclin domain-containing protein [Synechococcus sp.]